MIRAGERLELEAIERRSAQGRSFLLTIAGIVALSFVALPIFYLLRQVLGSQGQTLRIIIFRQKTLEILATTIALAGLVATLATIIGLALGWSLQNIKIPAGSTIRALVMIPIAIPSYIYAYCWLSVDALPRGFIAAVIVLTLATTPYIVLATMAAYARVDVAQLEVAETLGLNPFRLFLRIVFPQIRNTVLAGSLLIALYVLADFGAVSLLGVDTLTRSIHNTYQGSYDRSTAALLALILLVLSSLLVMREHRWRNENDGMRSSARITQGINGKSTGRERVGAIALIIGYVVIALIIPLTILLAQFFDREQVLDLSALLQATSSSILVSALGALLALIIAVPLALLILTGSRLGKVAEWSTLLVHALPGIVMGLALVSFGAQFPLIYQTITLLAMAYSILFLARSVGFITTAISRVPRNLEEISATLGKSSGETFRKITLPLALPGILSGALLVFLSAMKELPATLMLRPTGFETLATEIWSSTNIFRLSEAAPYALFLVISSAVPAFLISRPDKSNSERGELT